ncbi:hypothetical protein [Sphingomonas mucosissima]|uniref:Uncharacterized protein n=1 Tax=Sphingomonas mucosissima TaxID=370959 RepID=A0A245ZE12_9SPHN|nr:hypothetical protein [Sphingomonas mucosissima]OWK27974.1 hypothetical protein SPMU_32190 [Sphingomonas mucosissima]
MAQDEERLVHADFKMVERSGAGENGSLRCIEVILRSAWPLPVDTFVTTELPLLMTKLNLLMAVGATQVSEGQPEQVADPALLTEPVLRTCLNRQVRPSPDHSGIG